MCFGLVFVVYSSKITKIEITEKTQKLSNIAKSIEKEKKNAEMIDDRKKYRSHKKSRTHRNCTEITAKTTGKIETTKTFD